MVKFALFLLPGIKAKMKTVRLVMNEDMEKGSDSYICRKQDYTRIETIHDCEFHTYLFSIVSRIIEFSL